MAHDLAVSVTRLCGIDEFLGSLRTAWDDLAGQPLRVTTTLNQIRDGVVAPEPPEIGHGDALYVIDVGPHPSLFTLGTYQELNEDWESVGDMAARAVAHVRYGSPELAHLLAAAAVVGLARLNDGRIRDVGGHWVGGDDAARSADEFLERLRQTSQYHRWTPRAVEQLATN